MGIESRNKGKRGERTAALYLRGMGFPDAGRTAQRSGKLKADVECLTTLPDVHIEVKRDKSFIGGTEPLVRALAQATRDCGDMMPCVLWRPPRARRWHLTFHSTTYPPVMLTVMTDADIKTILLHLQDLGALRQTRPFAWPEELPPTMKGIQPCPP